MPVSAAGRGTTWWAALVSRTDDRHDLAACGLLGALLLLVLITFDHYGITWDETWHLRYGDKVLAWYRSGFSDEGALSYRANYLYGGAFDALGALFRERSSADDHQTMHLFGGVIGWLGVLGTWRLGRLLGGSRAGFWSVAFLATTPPYWGHMFNNPKDLPFAVGYVWALLAVLSLRRQLPNVRTGEWIRLAIGLGLAMSVRIAGLLAICYALLIVGLTLAMRSRRARSWSVLRRDLGRVFPPLVGVLATAWAIMLVAWPWALLAPLRRPLLALGSMARFDLHVRRMPFGGEMVLTTDAPWDYLPTYFAIKLPEVILVLAVTFAVMLGAALWRSRKPSAGQMDHLALALFILFPPAFAIAGGSPLYDGLRHFLFLLPPIAVAAALAVEAVRGWLSSRLRLAALIVPALLGLACLDQARIMVHLHPHEYVFFNRLAGGLPGTVGRYSTDYYGNTHREAIEGLLAHLRRTEPESYLERSYRVSACVPRSMLDPFLPPNFNAVREKKEADFHIGYLRKRCSTLWPSAPIVHEVQRFGTTLSVVRDRRRPMPGS